MNISPQEAQDALRAIQQVTQKTRRSLASSGAYFLIGAGLVWTLGFLSTHFLTPEITNCVWGSASLVAAGAATYFGSRSGQRVRSPEISVTTRRAIILWLLLIAYCATLIGLVQPVDGKLATLIIVLFMMIGQLAMGLLLSFSTTWWALPITILALAGYFFFPSIFYLWIGLLVGGGIVAFGLFIRLRW